MEWHVSVIGLFLPGSGWTHNSSPNNLRFQVKANPIQSRRRQGLPSLAKEADCENEGHSQKGLVTGWHATLFY